MAKLLVTLDKNNWKMSWPPLLSASMESLRQLAGETEQDFLHIGSEMQSAYLQTMELSQIARQLVDIVGGDRIGRLMEQLRHLLSEMANSLDQAQKRNVNNCSQIAQVGSALKQIRQPIEDFRRIAKQLYIFEVLIRIESTYLKEMGAEFVNLATDIRKLSSQIKGKTSFIKENIESLSGTVGYNNRFFEQEIVKGEQHKNNAITNTEQSLASLESIHRSYFQSGAMIESTSNKNSEDISEIVQSLQIHDSYRQQIEHILEAIENISPYFADTDLANEDQSEQGTRKAIVQIGDVCEIQHAQLTYAGNFLYDTVENIIAKLRGMRESQQRIIADISSGFASDNLNNSFIGKITANMTSVTDLLQVYGKTTAAMDDMLHNVLRTMGDITTFIHDVEQFGSEIIQIALNARVKAVCTGQDGVAMSSLSDEVGQLSKDAIHRTTIISNALGEIQTITESISNEIDSEQDSLAGQFAEMQSQLHQLLATLEQIGGELCNLIEQMHLKGETLVKEFDQLIHDIDVHKRVHRMAAEVLDKLEQVYTAARTLYPADTAFKQELHGLEQRYTMESERRIHSEIARKQGVGFKEPVMETKPGGVDAASEFGDNIELF